MMGFVGLLKFTVKCLDIFAWPVFGLGYPLCASVQAIETNSNSDTQKLITYWISISVVLLFEHAFQLEWLTFWPYMKLMTVGCLVLPDFDGSLYVYQHLVRPCLSMDPSIITCQFNKLEELLFKKDDLFVEVERYVKENGSDALKNLIDSTLKSEQPKLPARLKYSNAVEITEKLKFEQSKLPARFKDSNAVGITEEKEVASTTQLKFEQPKLPPILKDSNDVQITEKKEVSSTKQVRQIEPDIGRTENKTFEHLENANTAATIVGGRDLYQIPPEKVQKVLAHATGQSETVLKSHLQGNQTKEPTQVKNQTPKGEVSPASVGKRSNVATETTGIGVRDPTGTSPPQNLQKVWTCFICQLTCKSQIDINSHLQGLRHKIACELHSKNQASIRTNFPENKPEKCTISNSTPPENRIYERKMQGKQENLMKSRFVEIKNSKWWCTICNVSCTSEGDMTCHLKGNKHLATRNSKRLAPAIRNGNEWLCTICNVSCTSEGNMHCHLNGNKHLAMMRELDGLGGGWYA